MKEDRLARAFLGPRKKASHHHGAGSRRQGFGDVTRELDASVGNDRDPGFLGCARTLGHRRDLGHTGSRHHARRADGSRPDPHLDAIDPELEEVARAIERGHVAGHQVDLGKFLPQQAHGFQHAGRVPVSRVDHHRVDPGRHQLLGPLEIVSRHSDRGAHAQPSVGVLRCVGILDLFLNIFDGDQSLQVKTVIHDEKFLHPVLMEDFPRLFERSAHGYRDEVFFRHHFFNRQIQARLEAQVPVRQDAHQLAVFGDRHARNFVLVHDLESVRNPVLGAGRDGIDDHSAFRALHLVDLRRLALDGHRAVYDADAALLRERDGQPRIGDRVHRRADHGNIQQDLAGEARSGVNLRRQDLRLGGHQKDVIKSQRLRNWTVKHTPPFRLSLRG